MGVLRTVGIVSIGLGIVVIIAVSVVAYAVVPNIVDKKIKEETRLILESETWEKWVDITIPFKLKFYIYNITNPWADLSKGEKFEFAERGPYVYDEHRYKVDVGILDDEGEIKYRQKIDYFFNKEESIGSDEDLVNVPNIPLISAATVGMGTYSDEILHLVDLLIGLLTVTAREDFVKRGVSVREILFDGYDLNPIYGFIPEPPHEFEGLKFGLYRNRNGSDDGEYVIKSGVDHHEEFGQIVSWKPPRENVSLSALEWWYTQEENSHHEETFCNKINGSDGSLHPPFITKDTTLRLFQTDVCRSLHLTYTEEIEIQDIPGYRFQLPENLFQGPDINPDNECFCPNPSPEYGRLAHQCISGVIRIFPCKEYAPIVTSNPHFMHADERIFDPIVIDPPNPDLHTTYIVVEPDSGMVLEASKKVQINVELQPLHFATQEIPLFENLNFTTDSILLPVVWADEFAELDEETAKDLYDKLIKPQKIVKIVTYVFLPLGAVLLLFGFFAVYKGR